MADLVVLVEYDVYNEFESCLEGDFVDHFSYGVFDVSWYVEDGLRHAGCYVRGFDGCGSTGAWLDYFASSCPSGVAVGDDGSCSYD